MFCCVFVEAKIESKKKNIPNNVIAEWLDYLTETQLRDQDNVNGSTSIFDEMQAFVKY
jgi:hypothetical protein